MSITTESRVEMRPWNGFEDPGLPEGAWVASDIVSGDGSGGFMRVNFNFFLANDPLSSRMFSLEQWSAGFGTSLLGDALGLIQITGFDRLTTARLMQDRFYAFDLIDTLLVATAARPEQFPRSIWLGPPGEAGTGAAVSFQTANLNTVGMRVTAQGYVWGPRSRLAAGGPRRPPGPVFG